MQKKLSLLTTGLLIFLCSAAWGGSYQYLTAAQLKQQLIEKTPLLLIDIQVEEDFAQQHIEGALATYSFPVKSATDRSKLEPLIEQLKVASVPITIVCPRGGGGAKRAYDFLQSRGIASERLFILEKGQQGWPYAELLVTN